MKNTTPTPKNNPPLTVQEAQNIAQAYTRYLELCENTIVLPNTEAEKRGLLEFLHKNLFENAGELLGCFFTIRTEYEPMVQVSARLFERVCSINARKAEILAAQQGGDSGGTAKPANVVELEKGSS